MTEKSMNTMLSEAILVSLEETYESVKGIYLDKGTSIFETLATISAEEASKSISANCSCIAAHVAHMTYYNEILLQFARGERPETDWQHIWNTVKSVTPEEWQTSQNNLRESYQKVRELVSSTTFENENMIQGAMGILMHNAYHLGEIRQALCTIKQS